MENPIADALTAQPGAAARGNLSWSCPRRVPGTLGLLAVAFAGFAVTLDAPGRLLVAALVVVLAVLAAQAARAAPALRVAADGVHVRTGWRERVLPLHEIDWIARSDERHRGLRLSSLELDCRHDLVLVPGYLLGADLDDVVAELRDALGLD